MSNQIKDRRQSPASAGFFFGYDLCKVRPNTKNRFSVYGLSINFPKIGKLKLSEIFIVWVTPAPTLTTLNVLA